MSRERERRWDRRLLRVARLVAGWSKDPSTKVGAVIADARHRVLGLGFNGLPHGIPDRAAWLNNRAVKLAMVIHAEENAILFSWRDITGCTLYVVGRLPCPRCAAKIIQQGLHRVVTDAASVRRSPPEDVRLAMELFRIARVRVVKYQNF